MPAAALFRSLADPARLAIVRHLAAGPARVVDLTGEPGLAQSTVSAHLACLRDCIRRSRKIQPSLAPGVNSIACGSRSSSAGVGGTYWMLMTLVFLPVVPFRVLVSS
jgi:hypothetical protein